MESRTLLLVMALLSLAASGFAQRQTGEDAFHRFDKDKDGVVTAQELPSAKIRERFDQDGDGKVTLAEFRKSTGMPEPSPGEEDEDAGEHNEALAGVDEYIKKADKNGDGQLSKDEAGHESWFNRLDRNGDGVIGKVEIGVVRALVKQFGERGIDMDAP